MRRMIAAVATATAVVALTACEAPPPAPTPRAPETVREEPRLPPDVAVRNFTTVVRDVEPVAEQICRERTRGVNCDFLIVVDDRRSLPPNAFQTLDPSGRPVVGFTLALIADARNRDELAFILGHETAHHVQGHIPRGQQAAMTGAILAGVLATIGGADEVAVRTARDIGAEVGVRRYAKGFELEADEMGTRIALRAGYDPVRGAQYFARVPDPGNAFLGTHPPNAERIEAVRRAAGR